MNPAERIEGVWCVDSETGDKVLIDRLTNKIISRGGKIMDTENRYPAMSEAEVAFQEAYKKGREDAFAVAETEIVALNEEIQDLVEENDALKSSITNFVRLGVDLFKVEPSDEQ